MPGFTTQGGIVGGLPAWCSGKWKVDVRERFLRSLGLRRPVTGSAFPLTKCGASGNNTGLGWSFGIR